MRGTLNYKKPKSLAGGDFCSSYGQYNVHMMCGGIAFFFKKVTCTFSTFFEFLVLKMGHIVMGIRISISWVIF